MWEMITDMIPRRKSGMNTVTAMVLGAGIGIAAWEVMRRNNTAGNNTNEMAQMADSMMDAITD
ncbi:hypothetical protein CIG75_04930 [Tumebacillus algifaecis]|uniref:Uncharacterized protein n=1 Tax=Tumebacillus algifaecis TaxID=1214604 RepID=A0A223CYI9_9BACL|nr:hypothetical protein [Tumebacillus algifaecis]ASS74392.1 hypothetical protein CIG75_04930 [Tumebacillus algifaecis]